MLDVAEIQISQDEATGEYSAYDAIDDKHKLHSDLEGIVEFVRYQLESYEREFSK